ncbi:MAG TPA: DUF1850 domain-containing protein [Firmicutes bacterium]|nr:DUF1850 domain-containing protein [Bacillota bacterium]
MRPRVVVLCIALLGAVLVYPITVVEVCSSDGQVVLRRPLPVDGRFELHYTHSWDKTPVQDVFAGDDNGNLMLVEERYLWMGAGLDFHPRAELDFSGDMVRALAPRRLGRLHLAVGTVANQRLIFGREEVPLARLAQPGTKLTLQLKKASIFAVLSGS